MGQYKSQYTGPQIDQAVGNALNKDTSTLSNDVNHIPASSVVKSALDAKADKNDLATIHQTSPTCTETNGIAAGVFFYLDNELVVAKTAIANGATFTLNTNYEYPSAGALNALKSALGPTDINLNDCTSVRDVLYAFRASGSVTDIGYADVGTQEDSSFKTLVGNPSIGNYVYAFVRYITPGWKRCACFEVFAVSKVNASMSSARKYLWLNGSNLVSSQSAWESIQAI